MLSSLAISNIPALPIAASILLIGVMVLLGQQVHKEFSNAKMPAQKLQVLGQVIVIGVVPLLLAFLLVVIKDFSGGF